MFHSIYKLPLAGSDPIGKSNKKLPNIGNFENLSSTLIESGIVETRSNDLLVLGSLDCAEPQPREVPLVSPSGSC